MKAEFHISKDGTGGYSVTITGDLTAQSGDVFKLKLSEVLLDAGNSSVEISLLRVTAIDVSALQLLYAARESLLKGHASLSVVWPDNHGVDSLLSRTGFKQIFI